MNETISVATSHWRDLWVAIPFLLLALGIAITAFYGQQARQLRDREKADLYAAIAAEEARWRSVFWSGCHEYQQHDDGRRRAVRMVPGEDVLCDDWLGIGERVTK